MKNIFGEIGQMGFVVKDIKLTMETWAYKCGVGPWYFAENVKIQDFSYRGGAKKPGPIVHGAFAYSGRMQLELIELQSDVDCLYRDFLEAGYEGLQHWGYLLENYEKDRQRALDAGFVLGQDLVVPGQGPCTYFDLGGPPGTIAEMIAYTPVRKKFFSFIEKEAAQWDGKKDPLREFDPEKGIEGL